MIAITVLSAAPAWADPDAAADAAPDHRVGLAVRPAGFSDIAGVVELELDAAWRHTGALWWHAAVAAGLPAPAKLPGRVLEARLGIERRREACGRGCLYTGVDLALFTLRTTDDPEVTTAQAVHAVSRLGLDAGSDMLRFRLGVELWLGGARVHDDLPDRDPPVERTNTRFVTGFAVATGLSAQF